MDQGLRGKWEHDQTEESLARQAPDQAGNDWWQYHASLRQKQSALLAFLAAGTVKLDRADGVVWNFDAHNSTSLT